LVRIKTSRGPGLLTLTSSITSGLLISCRTAAFIGVFPINRVLRHFSMADFDTKRSLSPVVEVCRNRGNSSHFRKAVRVRARLTS
jgi:hypothetical protein